LWDSFEGPISLMSTRRVPLNFALKARLAAV
jgi:hypothetical protein